MPDGAGRLNPERKAGGAHETVYAELGPTAACSMEGEVLVATTGILERRAAEGMHSDRKRTFGKGLIGLGVLLCPCHLVIIVLLLGSTVVGAVLADNLPLVLSVAGAAFVLCLVFGLWLLRPNEILRDGSHASAGCVRSGACQKTEIVARSTDFAEGDSIRRGSFSEKGDHLEAR